MGHPKLSEVIDRVKETVAQGQLPVVVFDLDSTLFSTHTRNHRILSEFIAEHDEHDLHMLHGLTPDDLGWSVVDAARSAGLTDEPLLKSLLRFWFARFFTDDYVTSDVPLSGAVHYVNVVHQAGAMVYYLTGRHVHGMSQGTVQALTDAGFPFWRGRTTLHLKPTFELDDCTYKAAAMNDIRSHFGPVIATFENEPENANLFVRTFPDAMHFFLLTEHSPRPIEPVQSLIKTADFCL